MKARCCPRCLTIIGDPEDGTSHTCSPTKAWREMETEIAELKARLAAILGAEIQASQRQESGEQLSHDEQLLRLARLGLWCLNASYSDPIGDVDGGDIQDKALDLGILTTHEVSEPCGEHCACAEYGFPATCLREADWLAPFETQLGMRRA